MNALKEMLSGWPAPATCTIKAGRNRAYATPQGDFTSVTTFLKVLGTSTDALVKWSANEERKAVLAACGEVYAAPASPENPPEFIAAVEARIGSARSHQRILAKAGDIGTAAHQRVNWQLRRELGEDAGPEPVLQDASLWAWMAFDSFWKESGLRVVRTEQPIWNAQHGYAGTIDIIAEDTTGKFGGGLGIVDLKTSRGVYEAHHIQVAAYMEAAEQWAPIRWGCLCRLPKSESDPQFDVHTLGDLYGGRKLSRTELFDAFLACVHLWNLLMKPVEKQTHPTLSLEN